MRTAICGTSLSSYSGTIIAVIPAALRAVLKSVTKYTNNTGNSSAASAVTATTDYFFLLSEYEVFGTISRRNTATKPANRRSIRITAPETARSNTITARQVQPFIGGSAPRVPAIPRVSCLCILTARSASATRTARLALPPAFVYNSEFKPCALNGRTGGRRSRNVSTEVTTRRKPGGVHQPRPRNLRFHVQPRQNLTEKLHVLFLAAALQCGARGVPAYQDGKSDLHSQRRR